MLRSSWFAAVVVLGSCSGSTSHRSSVPAPPVKVGSILVNIEPTTMIRPTLPVAAAAQGISGPVMLEIRIAETGDVSVLSVVRGDPLLNELAKEAVGQWKYRPVVVDGRVIPVVKVVAVPFLGSEGRRFHRYRNNRRARCGPTRGCTRRRLLANQTTIS